MEETVECQECGLRYDSSHNAFCSRCGSEKQAPEPVATLATASRSSPARRRAQAGGVMLAAVGIISIILYATVAIAADTLVPDFAEDLLHDQDGGEFAIVLKNGSAFAPDIAVSMFTVDGMLLANGTSGPDGALNFSSHGHAAVRLVVDVNGFNFTQNALSLAGTTTAVNVDLANLPHKEWVGVDSIVSAMRGMLAFFIAMAAFVTFAGITAIRLKFVKVAITGAAIGVLPGFILFLAQPNIQAMLVLVVPLVALIFIIGGRRQFR